MKMPEEVTWKISRRAAEIAQDLAPKRTGRGAMRIQGISQKGEIGIEIPPDVEYMVYQDQGTRPHLQTELAGKTIPIRTARGNIIFRRATTANIGKKIVSRDEQGKIITNRIGWRNPGLKGQHFIEKALKQAVQEWISGIQGQEMMTMLDQSDVRILMDIIKGKR